MIKMENVRKTFNKGKLVALNDVNFEVKSGEVICVIGPSGSGKSTLIRCMSGLETPDSGSVLIDGDAMDFKHPKTITILLQSWALFSSISTFFLI